MKCLSRREEKGSFNLNEWALGEPLSRHVVTLIVGKDNPNADTVPRKLLDCVG